MQIYVRAAYVRVNYLKRMLMNIFAAAWSNGECSVASRALTVRLRECMLLRETDVYCYAAIFYSLRDIHDLLRYLVPPAISGQAHCARMFLLV